MADVVEVIKGLEEIQKHLDTGYSFAISWESELIRDALELLKEKQPMLIDVNQMKQLADGTDVWLEAKDDGEVYALTVARPWVGYYFDGVENGKYRCWTARPTDEQRKSVSWTNT